MKVTIEVDCTPEEARRFLGLPDLAPLQEEMLARLRERMAEAASANTPEAMLRLWAPFVPGAEAMLRAWTTVPPEREKG
ncbi:DUF6489 family protein [Falsiroseomonas oryziterrae]|uniref:DUF6489 family protein n=1 Tax=Falsiroseomonas oryziterrae TaxID=2911368 RepID=UPI001F443260|nr:DUF6489 family protein [Roseomonas sp. NPKOSM-4]